MADFIISGALLLNPAKLGQEIDNGRIDPNSREHSVERGWRHRDGIQQYPGEPILATACIMLLEKPNNKNIADSINIIFKGGTDPYKAFNYLVNLNLEYVHYFMLCINTLVGKAKEHDSDFYFRPEKMTLQTLQNIQQYINPKIDIYRRNIELGNQVPDYQHITEFLSGVDFDQLIEQRIYQERLFKLTDRAQKWDNISQMAASLPPLAWVAKVRADYVREELKDLGASRVEQLTARYLKEQGLAGVEYLGAADVATIQNQQIAEETTMLLDREVERQLQL
jgi:hypothetical protein